MSAFSDTHEVIAARATDTTHYMTLISSTEVSISFQWAQPYDGGSAITFYKIFWDDGLN